MAAPAIQGRAAEHGGREGGHVIMLLARRRGCIPGKVVVVTAANIIALPVTMPLLLSTFGDPFSTSVPPVWCLRCACLIRV